MGKKVPNILKKALFSYIERPENEVVEDLIKSCFRKIENIVKSLREQVVMMAKVEIKNALDIVDAETSLEKALGIMKQDMSIDKEFEEPMLNQADKELNDVMSLIFKKMFEEIAVIIKA